VVAGQGHTALFRGTLGPGTVDFLLMVKIAIVLLAG
jgi:hypothetical protein